MGSLFIWTANYYKTAKRRRQPSSRWRTTLHTLGHWDDPWRGIQTSLGWVKWRKIANIRLINRCIS